MLQKIEVLLNALNRIALKFLDIRDPSPLLKVTFVSVLILIGVLFVSKLASTESFLGTLAGAFIGAAVSAVCGFLTTEKGLSREELTNVVDHVLANPKAGRRPIDIDEIRKLKYFYYHTSDANGPFWMHLKFENYKLTSPFNASISVDIPKSRNVHKYNFEIFISEPNLILRVKSDDDREKTALHVIFDYCVKLSSENGGYFGFHSHLNWNRKDRINPLLLLEDPLPGTVGIGRQPAETGSLIFRKWLQLADNSLDDIGFLLKESAAE